MNSHLTANGSIEINAPASKVWQALTKPEIIKKYLFGTETKTDWKPGSPITFTGEWQGKQYQDKGQILAFEKEKLLRYSYWSSFSSLPDIPENYADVNFELQPAGTGTKLIFRQGNCSSEQARAHSEENWKIVLNKIKEIVENEG